MDIIVTGRNAEITPEFRELVENKLDKITQFYPRAQRVDVVVLHERNPSRADTAERIELTVFGKGPVIRAEAEAPDRYSAIDLAAAKLFERLRRLRDRAKDHRRYAVATGEFPSVPGQLGGAGSQEVQAEMPSVETDNSSSGDLSVGEIREEQLGDSPVLVRQKLHEAVPMTVDEAITQMELVGHDFFLFVDKENLQPCVAYHRKGWTYGVIRLDTKANVS